ncbi:ATP-binding protein [Paractinoplanes rishiriensis]|uniref:Uncharacterized protein n=1 Tax=Paractinoplanes rishiriensis TaxID=1050105 RepID=A0A919K1X5_9ACTN|nr:ATP-binding protein [Actinoplanes rishiriensis]GIE99165.1 hypothetical protein Ari01nite_66300 [Actinoplanes rishiriensis]
MSVSAACPPLQDCVHVEGDLDAAVALMSVHGAWSWALRQVVTTALHKCLAEHPEALIVDLSDLTDPRSESAPTWVAAQQAAAGVEPVLPVALCIPPGLPLADRMQRLCGRGQLPVFARVRQARVAVAGRLPGTERLTLTLPPEPDSPSIARNLVGDACLAWELPELLHRARLVMSELVTNAVGHARTTVTVGVCRRGGGVHLSVSDGVHTPPRLLPPIRPQRNRPLDDRGQGMRIVAATATAWGSLPTRTGKVVWATLTGPR